MDTPVSEVEDDEPDGDDDEPFELAANASDPEDGERQWVQTITTLLAQRTQDKDPSPRVQFALDMMFVAACERLTRLMHSDLDEVGQASA